MVIKAEEFKITGMVSCIGFSSQPSGAYAVGSYSKHGSRKIKRKTNLFFKDNFDISNYVWCFKLEYTWRRQIDPCASCNRTRVVSPICVSHPTAKNYSAVVEK